MGVRQHISTNHLQIKLRRMLSRTTRGTITVVLLVSFLISFVAQSRGTIPDNPSVVGTWRLISAESRSDDGQAQPTLGSHPAGVLMYDAGGRMSVHLMRRDRSAFTSGDMRGATADE